MSNFHIRLPHRSALSTAALGLIVFVFYLATLAPSLNWADGARLQLDVMVAGSTYWSFEEARSIPTDGLPFDRLGVAIWDHPLYIMLAQVFLALPLGEPLYRINLMSAVFGALTVVLVYRIGLFFLPDRWIAALGAVSLAVSHTYWFHAVTSEVYTLHLFFMSILMLVALRWPVRQRWGELALFAFTAGFGLANHLMLGLPILLCGIYILVRTPTPVREAYGIRALLRPAHWRAFFWGLGGGKILLLVTLFWLGLAPWWVQFIRMANLIGFRLTLELAFGYPWLFRRYGISALEMLANLLVYLGLLLYQFTPAGVLAGISGFWSMARKGSSPAILILTLLAAHVLFSANYSVRDQYTFHLPSYLVFALGITWGYAALWEKIKRGWVAETPSQPLPRPGTRLWLGASATAAVLLPVVLYSLTPPLLKGLGITQDRLGIPPIGLDARDGLSYFINPDSRGDDSAARFARGTLSQLAPNAIVIAPTPSGQETYLVLRYAQLVEGLRPDVRLELMLFDPIDDMQEAILSLVHSQKECRPLYLFSLDPAVFPLDQLSQDFAILPEAGFSRLVPLHQQAFAPAGWRGCTDPAARWEDATAQDLIRLAMRR